MNSSNFSIPLSKLAILYSLLFYPFSTSYRHSLCFRSNHLIKHNQIIVNNRMSQSKFFMTIQNDKIQEKGFFVSLLTGIDAKGGGQTHNGRAELHSKNMKRKMYDPQMWTHLFFVVGGLHITYSISSNQESNI